MKDMAITQYRTSNPDLDVAVSVCITKSMCVSQVSSTAKWHNWMYAPVDTRLLHLYIYTCGVHACMCVPALIAGRTRERELETLCGPVWGYECM